MANKVSKTTRKRTKNLKKVKRLVEVIIFVFLMGLNVFRIMNVLKENCFY